MEKGLVRWSVISVITVFQADQNGSGLSVWGKKSPLFLLGLYYETHSVKWQRPIVIMMQYNKLLANWAACCEIQALKYFPVEDPVTFRFVSKVSAVSPSSGKRSIYHYLLVVSFPFLLRKLQIGNISKMMSARKCRNFLCSGLRSGSDCEKFSDSRMVGMQC